MQNYQVIPFGEQYIEGFREAVGSVAREKIFGIFRCFFVSADLLLRKICVMIGRTLLLLLRVKLLAGRYTSLYRPIFAYSGVLGVVVYWLPFVVMYW
jgi:hypothetical protein